MYDNDVINNFYVDGNNNNIDSDMSTDTNMNSMNNMPSMNGMSMCNPINEGTQEKCVHRTIYHDVPQDCFFMIEK